MSLSLSFVPPAEGVIDFIVAGLDTSIGAGLDTGGGKGLDTGGCTGGDIPGDKASGDAVGEKTLILVELLDTYSFIALVISYPTLVILTSLQTTHGFFNLSSKNGRWYSHSRRRSQKSSFLKSVPHAFPHRAINCILLHMLLEPIFASTAPLGWNGFGLLSCDIYSRLSRS